MENVTINITGDIIINLTPEFLNKPVEENHDEIINEEKRPDCLISPDEPLRVTTEEFNTVIRFFCDVLSRLMENTAVEEESSGEQNE